MTGLNSIRAALLATALLLAGVRGGLAQPAPGAAPELSPEVEATARAAMTQLRSPYTASHTVDMCPSAGALRDSIRFAAASGQSTEQIVEDVIARHGEDIRILPKRSGVGLWAWLAPPLVIVVGAGLIAARLRRSHGEAVPTAAAPGSTLSETERGELVAAMREWDREGSAE